MPFVQRATWYENQCRRRNYPFFRLLDRSFSFRVLIAAVASFCLLAVVNRFENCHGVHAKDDCLTSSFYEIISIGNVESFSIVTAALVYIMEAGRRTTVSSPWRSSAAGVRSCTLAAVVSTEWIKPLSASTPIWTFIP
jgi:hypothetical protein